MLKRIALIDGDVMAYRCGFACEKNVYTIYEQEGRMVYYVESKTDLKKYLSDNFEKQYTWEVHKEVEPLEYCLFTVKSYINRVLEDTDADEHIVFFSPPENFRHEIAKTLPYKGNRTQVKPAHLNAIKEYTKERHEVVVPENMEADDAISIQARVLSTQQDVLPIICSIDKDFKQIPGMHYNTTTGETDWVQPEDATRYFYTQILTGDMTDNIRGVPGIGPKKAEKILHGAETEEGMWHAVLGAYIIEGLTYEDAIETARLVFLLHEPDKMWEPPNADTQPLCKETT